MAKKRLNPKDVLKYGPQVAAVKAGMPKDRWNFLLHYAKSHGHTVAGQLSGLPAPLMERTNASLRKQAEKTVGASYKPVEATFNQREAAAKFLADKRATDDAAYRAWITGEADKLDAQAHAADATLLTQQSDIASEQKADQTAARADTLQRVAGMAGNVSDPSQSKALDMTDADQHSRDQVANARTLTGDMMKIGNDAGTMAHAALIATAAIREATHSADNSKILAGIGTDRTAAAAAKAKDVAGMFSDLQAGEVSKAQSNQQTALAGAELGVKQQSLAQSIADANRKYGLEKQKFNLDKWKAQNAATVAQAKIQLGYDHIAATKGQHAADEALKKWVEKYRAKKAQERQDSKPGAKGSVGKEERPLYRQTVTVLGLIKREHQRGTDPSKIRQKLRKAGFDDAMITVAEDLRVHGGVLSPAGRAVARRMGILHPGYFWPSKPSYEAQINAGTVAGPPGP